jgi:hypothetical protein
MGFSSIGELDNGDPCPDFKEFKDVVFNSADRTF